MRKLSKEGAKIFNKIIELKGKEDSLKINNSKGFMPVSFELIEKNIPFVKGESNIYAIAHYYKQAGDLVPDPDMTFIQLKEYPDYIYPASFTDGNGYIQSLYLENGKWLIKRTLQKDQAVFANKWLKNIKDQQDI